MKRFVCIGLCIGLFAGLAAADEAAPTVAERARQEITLNLNVVWTCVAAFLVFFMQAGFAMVETGFTRAKYSSSQ